MKKRILFFVLLILSVTVFGQKLPFQGKLIETGVPVDGTRTLEFSIASQSWSETHVDVLITEGLYFVVLGSINPLPDSLFYGVDQQNMDISVNGTALSPVVIFKPLSSPFEGSDLSVKNADGTLVGTMRVKNDTINKNGELILNGTNGNPNFTISGLGNGGNRGYFQLHDTLGTTRANIFSTFDAGIFTLFGGNSGYLQGGFNKAAGETVTDLPFLSLESNDNYLAYLSTSKYDTTYQGKLYLGSNNSEYFTQNPSGFSLYRDGKQLMYAQTQNWGGQGYSGHFDVRGPNSSNIGLSSRHWENPDLPWMRLIGSENQDVIQLSAETDSLESGSINILSKNGNNTYLSANAITTSNNGNSFYELTSQDWGGQGPTGLFKVHGQSTQNFELTSQSWINPNFPWFKMSGDQMHDAINMYVDNDGTEAANIDLFSMGRGTSSFTTDVWKMNGTAGENHLRIAIEDNDYGVKAGRILTYSANDLLSVTEPTKVALVDVSNQEWNSLVMMDINNDSGNGWAGNINIGGPNWGNFYIGAQNNPDLPYMRLLGTENHEAMVLGCTDDAEERAFIILRNKQTGDEMSVTSNAIGGNAPLNLQSGVNISNGAVVNGTLEVYGDIVGSGTFGYSDRRLKTNIESVGLKALEKVQLIEGVSYNWRVEEFPERNFSSDKQIGLIAQELEAQFPELVKTNADGYKSVNYNGFTAVLLEAVKELNTKVEKLEAENSQLRAEISSSEKTSKEIAALQQQVLELAKLLQANQNSDILFEDITTPGLK